DTLVLRTTFGIVRSSDRGRTWTWECEMLFGYGRVNFDPPLALGAGTPMGPPLFLGLADGVVRSPDGCTASRMPELDNHYAGDLTSDPTGSTVYWVGSDTQDASGIWAASGGPFTPRGASISTATFGTL